MERPTSNLATRSGLSANRPFPGLRPYYLEDQEFFFGREEQVFALYRLFDHSRFVAVVGSSGSGKSSLVRAGFLPLLERESSEPTGRVWTFIQIHPGDSPISSLASAMAAQFFPNEDVNVAAARRERIKFALRRSSFGMADALREIGSTSDACIVLVVDQFEELFRYAARRQTTGSEEETQRHEEATQFVQVLLAASRDRTLNVYVLLTMRSDFIGDCAMFRGLPAAVSTSQFLVPSLTRDQREQAIREPIAKAGASIEPELVERLLNDSGDDELPVLQHCLLRLWETAVPRAGGIGRHVTTQHYEDIGGIAHALSKHADDVRRELAGTGLAVEQLFRSIAEIDSEGRIVRRSRLFKELRDETGVVDTDLHAVIDRFRDDNCSFLTPPKSEVARLGDGDRIDVGHEALLRRWPRVSGDTRSGAPELGWLRQEVADGRIYRGLLAMSEFKTGIIPADSIEDRWKWWNERPRTPAWADRYGGRIEDVKRLLENSLAAAEAERERERQRLELKRQEERRRAEDSAERQRIELEAKAARDREAAALRFARLARAAAAAVFILLLFASGLAFLFFEQRENARQQQRAAKKDLEISTRLVTLFQDQLPGLLDSGRISPSGMKQMLAAADRVFELFPLSEKSPAVLSSHIALLLSFSDLYYALNDFPKALEYAQQSRSIALPLATADSSDNSYQNQVYSADFRIGDAQTFLSKFDAALQAYNDAVTIAQRLSAADPRNYVWPQEVAFVMNKIGDVYKITGLTDQALKQYQDTLTINQKLANDHPEVSGLQRDLATTFVRIGDLRNDQGNTADALANFQSALKIRKALADKSPDDGSLQSNLSVAYNRVADILVRQRQFDQAAALYNAALTIRRNLAAGPFNPNWQSNLAFEYVYIGDMLMAKQDFVRAAENYRKSLDIRESLVRGDASNRTWMRNLAGSHEKLADALRVQGQLADALNERKIALSLRLSVAAQLTDNATRHGELANEYIAIGDIKKQQGDNAGAAASYREAVDVVTDFIAKHPGSTLLNKVRDVATKALQSLQPIANP